ncbi:hypothetical protein CPB86DRAFT_122976 [Serendipita vermifera]|nr:hypothetical protein CPB86DRAFT_122976 [Serendipita vermifera]
MDSLNAVEYLVQAATSFVSQSPGNPTGTQRVSQDEILSSLISICALLQKAEQDVLSFAEYRDMGRLLDSQSIQSFVECRQDRSFSSTNNWPTALLFHLSAHCSRSLSPIPPENQRNHSVCRALTAIHLQACLQLPLTWDSCISTLKRRDSSSLSQIVVLRLMFLSIVGRPKNSSIPLEWVSSAHSAVTVYFDTMLRMTPFLPRTESLLLGIGIISGLSCIRYPSTFSHSSYWLIEALLQALPVPLDTPQRSEGHEYKSIVKVLLKRTPIISWLFYSYSHGNLILQSRSLFTLLCEWLFSVYDTDGGQKESLWEIIHECAQGALECLAFMVARWEIKI